MNDQDSAFTGHEAIPEPLEGKLNSISLQTMVDSNSLILGDKSTWEPSSNQNGRWSAGFL